MKFKCEICGKVIDPAHVREKAPVTLCPECTEEEVRRVVREMDEHRKEIIEIQRWISDMTGKTIAIGSSIPVTEVLVYDGMKELAEALGEEIQVIERDDEEENSTFCWTFQFYHNGICYHTYGRAESEEDRAIAEEWEAKHETF